MATVANRISAMYSPIWPITRVDVDSSTVRIVNASSAICTSRVSGVITNMPSGKLYCAAPCVRPTMAIRHPTHPISAATPKRVFAADRRRTVRSSVSASSPATITAISGSVKRSRSE